MPPILHDDPQIVLHEKFLEPEEIESLISIAKELEMPTRVVDHATGDSTESGYRTGIYSFLPNSNGLVKKILDRIVELTNIRPCQLEGLQVLKYGPGDEYLPHDDIFHPNLEGSKKALRLGGQRIMSLICSLKAADEGGALYFPRIEKTFTLAPGQAVLFWNLHQNGAYNHKAQHAARAVLKGEKISLVTWIRERAFDGSEEKIPEAELKRLTMNSRREREVACAKAVESALAHFQCRLLDASIPSVHPESGLLTIKPQFKIVAQ